MSCKHSMALLRATAIAQTFYLVPWHEVCWTHQNTFQLYSCQSFIEKFPIPAGPRKVCILVPQAAPHVVQYESTAMFSPAVLDHFKNPRNAGNLLDATTVVEVTNPVCGDVLQLAIKTVGNQIVAAR